MCFNKNAEHFSALVNYMWTSILTTYKKDLRLQSGSQHSLATAKEGIQDKHINSRTQPTNPFILPVDAC